MEVHHHPHVEKKSFKEYFLEFLMIFLAVTMGFIAENVREKITEHHRAKLFAISLKQDLISDTTTLHKYMNYFSTAENYVDTFMQLISTHDIKDVTSGKLYWYGLWGGAHTYFVPNDATIDQLKSSGSLSYFEPRLAQNIAKYDRLCRMVQANDEMNQNVYVEVRKTRAMIFDFKYNEMANEIVQNNKVSFSQQRIDSFVKTNPPLLSHDKVLMNEYVELVRSRFLNSNVALADSALKQAKILFEELNKDYGRY